MPLNVIKLLLLASLATISQTEDTPTMNLTTTLNKEPTPDMTSNNFDTDFLARSPHTAQAIRKLLARAQALNNIDEQLLQVSPSYKFFQMETAELLKRYNAGLWQPNITYNGTYDYEDEPACFNGQNPIGTLITMILYSIVCIIGLFGNTLVIYVVLRFSKMQTVTNIYILNLAIADECFLIGIPFLLYTMHIGSWQFGEYMCKAYMVSTSITQFTSSIFLLIMSADRYIAVCHPISSPRYRTPFVSKIVSFVAWLTSVLLILPVILFASTVRNGEHISCNIKWPEAQNNQSGTTFILYTLSLGFATPLTFILGFYYLVIRKLHTVGPKHKSKEKKRSHRKVTKLVLTVITVYIMCWLPYWISQVALINSSPGKCASRLEITIFLLVGCLGYSNSAMNPILYAFLSDNFKKSFMKACTCAARKDVNAQLQLENSLFPKLGKGRQSERLIANQKAKKAMVARNNNACNMLTTTTATTTTTTGISNTATICADAGSSVYPSPLMVGQKMIGPAETQMLLSPPLPTVLQAHAELSSFTPSTPSSQGEYGGGGGGAVVAAAEISGPANELDEDATNEIENDDDEQPQPPPSDQDIELFCKPPVLHTDL